MKFVIALLSLLMACAPVPRFYLQYGTDFKQSDLEKMLAENPLPMGENIKVITLGQGPAASHHVVQIRDRESPHLHKTHDATVMMLKGQGYLMLEQRRIDLTVGDVVYIPRGAAHYFINTAPEPTVAFAIYSPPFDGKDMVPVKTP
jgi:mannose-6-phosphate isomerase-like protein (cupin superfamily)